MCTLTKKVLTLERRNYPCAVNVCTHSSYRSVFAVWFGRVKYYVYMAFSVICAMLPVTNIYYIHTMNKFKIYRINLGRWQHCMDEGPTRFGELLSKFVFFREYRN